MPPETAPLPPRPDDAPFLERLLAFLGTRMGRTLKTALVGAVVVLFLSVVLRQARASVLRQPAYRLGPGPVVFMDLPPWVDASMRAELEAPGLVDRLRTHGAADPAVLGRLAPLCVFQPGIERRLKEILATHPMVLEVTDLEVRFPGEVRAWTVLRTPVALVRTRVRYPDRPEPVWIEVPVSTDGVVLDPTSFADFLARRQAVRITGVEAAFPGLAPHRGDSKGPVAEGIEAARVANRLNRDLARLGASVAEVDVSRFPAPPTQRRAGEVAFRLADGRRVQWGRTDRDASVEREDPYAVKAERLVDLLERLPRTVRRDLDVRFPLDEVGPAPLGDVPATSGR